MDACVYIIALTDKQEQIWAEKIITNDQSPAFCPEKAQQCRFDIVLTVFLTCTQNSQFSCLLGRYVKKGTIVCRERCYRTKCIDGTSYFRSGFQQTRVSPRSRNGNIITFTDDQFNVISVTWFLNCVFQPKIHKGKAPEKVIHPYSRKAAYLAREETKQKRKERSEGKKTITKVRIMANFVIYLVLAEI